MLPLHCSSRTREALAGWTAARGLQAGLPVIASKQAWHGPAAYELEKLPSQRNVHVFPPQVGLLARGLGGAAGRV